VYSFIPGYVVLYPGMYLEPRYVFLYPGMYLVPRYVFLYPGVYFCTLVSICVSGYVVLYLGMKLSFFVYISDLRMK
jgi:hypothetical protein